MKVLFYGLCPLLLITVSGLPAMAGTGSLPQTRIEQAMSHAHDATQKPTIEAASMPQTRIQQSIASTKNQFSPADSQASVQSAMAMTRLQQAIANRQLGHWQ